MANLKEGFAYVWSTPAVLALMTLAYVPRIFAVPYQTLMPVFQKDVLKIGPEGLGMLMAAPGVGAVIAILTIASMGNRIKRQGRFLVGSIIVLGAVDHAFLADHLVSAGAGDFGRGRHVSNVFSRQHRHHAANDRSRRTARPGAEPLHARPRLHAARRAVRRHLRSLSSARQLPSPSWAPSSSSSPSLVAWRIPAIRKLEIVIEQVQAVQTVQIVQAVFAVPVGSESPTPKTF